MKRIICLSIYFFIVLCSVSQPQTGYVKTKGRLINGDHIVGQPLGGAIVQINRQKEVLSQKNGTFSFIIPSKKFFISKVQKSGLVLADPDVLNKHYSYSTNPLILVMENPSHKADDKLETERKLRRTLSRQLQQREDEIERLKQQNKLTEEQYHNALQQLYSEQEKSLNLVSQMAERYSRIDFDQLDEFNRNISECIIEGRLTEADSLIKSKGDLNQRINTHKKHHEANMQARKDLEDSETIELKDRDDLAQDCYNQFLIHKLQHDPDSAAYYIEQRALLDTANVDWLYDAAIFLKNCGQYEKALSLFLTAHHQHDINKDADILKNAAKVSERLHLFDKAISFYEQAVEKYIDSSEDSIALILNLYDCYNGLVNNLFIRPIYNTKSLLYIKLNNDLRNKIDSLLSSDVIDLDHYHLLQNHTFVSDNAKQYYERILLAMEAKYGEKSLDVANQYRVLGSAYRYDEIPKALEYYQKACDIINEIDSTNPLLGTCFADLATLYQMKSNRTAEDIIKIIDYNEKYISSYMNYYGEYYHDFYNTYLVLSDMYLKIENDTMALKNLFRAVELKMKLYGDSSDIASAYSQIASIYERQNKDTEALKFLLFALDCSKKWAAKTTEAIAKIRISDCEERIGDFYFSRHNYESALSFYLNSKTESKQLGQSNNHGFILSPEKMYNGKIGLCYIALSDTCKGLEYIYKALKSIQMKMLFHLPHDINEQINKSSEHIQNGQYSESVQLILNILQNLDNIDDQKWILKSTLKSTQKDISFLKNGLSQIMHENQQTKK